MYWRGRFHDLNNRLRLLNHEDVGVVCDLLWSFKSSWAVEIVHVKMVRILPRKFFALSIWAVVNYRFNLVGEFVFF